MKVMVSGLINMEASCPVKQFPIEYFPIDYPFSKIALGISGVGYNLIRNFMKLGDDVTFVSMVGSDLWGDVIREQLEKEGFCADYVYPILSSTPQSIILYDNTGKREIYCDLKDYQEIAIDISGLEQQIEEADFIIACNSNFNRPICEMAKRKGKRIATDVHVFSKPEDDYNRDFLKAADVVFLSDEGVQTSPEELIKEINQLYHNKIIVMGCGKKGALLFEAATEKFTMIPAVTTRPVVSTSGAGDALFSTFLHFYGQGNSPVESLRKATYVASYKIGERISSEGFLTESELEKMMQKAGRKGNRVH